MLTLPRGLVVCALAGAAAGLAGGWALWHPRGRIVETPAAEVRNTDSSLTLERRPDATAKPSSIVPSGTLERLTRLRIQPNPVVVHDTAWLPAPPNVSRGTLDTAIVQPPRLVPVVRVDTVIPPPIEVELALVRQKDGMRRVTASAKGGVVLGGIDIPVESAAPERVLRWSTGATYDPSARTYGGFITRDLGPVRALLAADRSGPNGQLTGKVGLAIRW